LIRLLVLLRKELAFFAQALAELHSDRAHAARLKGGRG
jgi:hypothetical protein